MRILDLFSGLGGFSQPFRDRGHEVVTLDIEAKFKSDIVADVRSIRYPSLSLQGDFDVVLASPPCEGFSIASVYRHWDNGTPISKTVYEGIALVTNTLRLVAEIQPAFWVMENPVAMLRRVVGTPAELVYWCSFQENLPRERRWKKPTDLWGRYPRIGRPCIPHAKTPRGSHSSGAMANQIRNPAIRAKLPYGLGEELCKRMEKA